KNTTTRHRRYTATTPTSPRNDRSLSPTPTHYRHHHHHPLSTHQQKSLSNVGTEKCYTHSLGVFWLCAGNDRLDVLPVGRVNAGLRRVLRRRTGLDTVDDNCRTLLPGTAAERDGDRGAGELDGELRCWNWFPKFKDCLGKLYIPTV
uniref:Uncharacterized protein n=1 Tax=Anopheles albimanus TaxID=7167 RepID=A0A182FDC2_ANOAL